MLFREVFVKKNYFSNNVTDVEKAKFAMSFNSSILMNIRTYDTNSVILYVNDHLNNFVHIYITDGKMVTFMFNYEKTIMNASVVCPGVYFCFAGEKQNHELGLLRIDSALYTLSY